MLVDPESTLEDLHWVIQAAMPWTNSHLHQFSDRDSTYYSDPRFKLEDVEDETRAKLKLLLVKPKDRIVYEYDFGDGWKHGIELEKILPADPKQRLPACLAGKRAAPPEDCGGPWAYGELLAALKNPKREGSENGSEWFGGKRDPAAFEPADFARHSRRLGLR